MIEDIKRFYRLVKDAPPFPKEIRMSDKVPWPRVYRQWLTDGSMILWCNTEAIEQLPRRDGSTATYLDAFHSIIPIGIPVVKG